ncbi:MAG TPA: aspartate kinase [Ohtaekwangia sp.]|nr:aspartate kinase [Ohtaekwangia sp.]
MKVFKFGGASLKNAAKIKQVASILASIPKNQLLVVVSAMGKTTNLLEQIHTYAAESLPYEELLNTCKQYHTQIITELFFESTEVTKEVEDQFTLLELQLKSGLPFDQVYDQVVSKGEIISSIIVHHFLRQLGFPTAWLDAKTCIATDRTFREGKIDWQKTTENIIHIEPLLQRHIVITQGFIGGTEDQYTTTLGREGSDFSAAIFASCLKADSVTIWKDVPGVMNADPKRMNAAVVFDELPFREAAEMTYYGASVIHPKTIKPLANKGISLYVKNFDDPTLPGTHIHECIVDDLPPLIVFKDNQCLVSCKVTDYSFINENQLSTIFSYLNELDIRINVMQNSAISFSFCIDFRESKLKALIQKLQRHFEVYYNTGLTLITVKNYDEATFEAYRKKPGVILEQSSRSTLQVLMKL